MLPIKTLIIAPYEGLRDAISDLLIKYPEIEADLYVADLNEAVILLDELKEKEYEVIISRGGTAEILRSHTSIPVIEISISIYDLLRGIKMAESFSSDIVIAGFRIFTENAVLICNLLQYAIPIYTIANEQDASETLAGIIKNHGKNSVILCDKIMHSYSNQEGMHSILITSGTESIDSAMKQAIQIVKNKRTDQMIVKCLELSLDNNQLRMLIYNEDKLCIYSSFFDNKELKWIHKNIDDVFERKKEKQRNKYRQMLEDKTMEMISSHLTYDEKKFYVFTVKLHEKSPFTLNNGIKIFHYRDLKKLRKKRIHNLISFSHEFMEELRIHSLSTYPTLLVGESGTGKDQGAYYMYEMGPHTGNPLYVIDCKILADKHWKYLITHENSPLFDVGSTIYIKNMQCLDKEVLSWLDSQLLYSDFYENNKYILSIVKDEKENRQEALPLLSNHHSINRLYFPAVRERMEEFAAYCALYLNEYNTRFGKQVIGFAPNAMDLMKSYSWPYNLNQLKRVLKELIVRTTTPYILYDDVNYILSTEAGKDHVLLDGYYGINTRKTMAEINRDVLSFVLEEEKGNQSRAAKRLGISRGTIWKMLKE